MIEIVKVPPPPGLGVGVALGVDGKLGVPCVGGWLLEVLPLPPPGGGNVGRRSTVPMGTIAVGAFWERVLSRA